MDDIAKNLIARCYKTDEEINIIDFEELFNDEIIDNNYLNELIDDLFSEGTQDFFNAHFF